jgi:leucine dehydrogenase
MKITTLDVASHPEFNNHHNVTEFICPDTNLHAIIAVHNLNRGQALGGCRFYPYASRDDAVTDVLRLSKGMTYKSALAGLALGGGKSVIIGNPRTIKTDAMMQKFGEAIESLNGNYITAEDVGSTEHDMVQIATRTSYVAGLPADGGHDHVTGNPSPITALGAFYGLKAAVNFKLNRDDMRGIHVAIQGMGAVGRVLADYLLGDGAHISIADMNQDILKLYKDKYPNHVSIVDVNQILFVPCDVLAPCAMGAVLNETTIPNIKAIIIAGAANNQLATINDDKQLFDQGILYAPDYAINSGGVTSVGYEYFSRSGRNPYDYDLTQEKMLEHVATIKQTMTKIFEISKEQNIPTGMAANRLAESLFL